MDEPRKSRDFSKGPLRDTETNRWHVEVRYPDGSRLRKRFRRERDALRVWSTEQMKIENGTWHDQAPRTVTLGTAFTQYRAYSTVQNRSHRSYVEPALTMWEAQLGTNRLLSKITPAHIEDVKLRRALQVAHSTVDKNMAVLKSFFSWCIARNLAASNPVRRVKFSMMTIRDCATSVMKSTPACSRQPGRWRPLRIWPRRLSWRRIRDCAGAACSPFAGTRLTS